MYRIYAYTHIRRFKEDNQRLRWLTQDETSRLLKELPVHTKAMTIFTLATGLRESNVTGLEWSQVDMQNKIAWIHADQSKNGKERGFNNIRKFGAEFLFVICVVETGA